ncbi:MAG TPA: hypothetical protein VGB00_06555, partial [Pyrinomonadaceae bacterium]
MNHYCHAHKCKTEVPPRLFACKKHWSALPPNLKMPILANYRKGQEIDKTPTLEYIKAVNEAKLFLAE